MSAKVTECMRGVRRERESRPETRCYARRCLKGENQDSLSQRRESRLVVSKERIKTRCLKGENQDSLSQRRESRLYSL